MDTNTKPNQEDVNLGHWVLAAGVEFRADAMGFVYEITYLKTNRKYIGKKQMISNRKLKPLKGKTRRRHVQVESDWRDYVSSSNEINETIKAEGKTNFKFEILGFYNSKSRLAYEEAKLQFEKNVLFDDNYINGIINIRLSKIKD